MTLATSSADSALIRCPWGADPLMRAYHDEEWGVPVHDDRRHFEFLVLEGAQAGLSWSTILKKRAGYARAFAAFDPDAVARYDERDVQRLLTDPAIVRNERKIRAAVQNARAFLAVRERDGSFDNWIWQFVGGAPLQHDYAAMAQVPATTPESDAMSAALKRTGFSFVGSTICYAFMQATGMVNDHLLVCFRHPQVRALALSR
jgi:DNA-3-methyladenine glycosylase I